MSTDKLFSHFICKMNHAIDINTVKNTKLNTKNYGFHNFQKSFEFLKF